MTCSVDFEKLKPVKATSLKWSRRIENYSDTGKIEIPAICRYIDGNNTYENVVTGQKIIEGTKVKMFAGYDGKNDLQFDGFIKRINASQPLEIECEGYSYQLRQKTINISFGKTTVKKVLEFLIKDTDIKLSDKISGDTIFEPKQFKNVQKTAVLDWLKEQYKMKVFFFFDQLFVGLGQLYKGDTIKHRLNWNIVKENDLLFNTYTGTQVNIEGYTRLPDGTQIKARATNVKKTDQVLQVKMIIQHPKDLQAATDEVQLKENKKGYAGSLTGFLKPYAQVGMVSQIIDKKFEDRNGSYIIDGVDGSFGTSGGRQKIHIDFSVKDNGKA